MKKTDTKDLLLKDKLLKGVKNILLHYRYPTTQP